MLIFRNTATIPDNHFCVSSATLPQFLHFNSLSCSLHLFALYSVLAIYFLRTAVEEGNVVPCGKTLRVFLSPIRDGEILFPHTDAHSHKYDRLGYEGYLQKFKKCITAVLTIFLILIKKKLWNCTIFLVILYIRCL